MLNLDDLDRAFHIRKYLFSPSNAYCLINETEIPRLGMRIDVLGEVLYIILDNEDSLGDSIEDLIKWARSKIPIKSIYFKSKIKNPHDKRPSNLKPKLLDGVHVEKCIISEEGAKFILKPSEGYSYGLFLDQRENRVRMKNCTNGLSVLNTFSYTCSFGVMAALGGAKRVCNVDLSKNFLNWGKENFRINGIEVRDRDFIFGDTREWFARFLRQKEMFNIIILDPPTFSSARNGGQFKVEEDYVLLIKDALKVLDKKGILFCSQNKSSFTHAKMKRAISAAFQLADRKISRIEQGLLPVDFKGSTISRHFWVYAED